MQQLKIIIDKAGNVKVEVAGVVGSSCLDLTKTLEEALGGKVEEREFKPSFYQSQEETVNDTEYQREGS